MAIYWERQAEALCGVHALNALLQFPAFTPGDLGDIGVEIDREERALLDEVAANTSENVASDGNFSVQVLAKALDVYGLSLSPLASPRETATRAAPEREVGFTCNLRQHWFSLRRVDETWWDLNSVAPGPRKIGGFYLSAFLDQLAAEGFSIFVVRDLGSVRLPENAELNQSAYGKWYTEEEAMRVSAEAHAAQSSGRTKLAAEKIAQAAQNGIDSIDITGGGDAEDEELQQALAASMSEHRTTSRSVESNMDADLHAAIAASLVDAGITNDDAGDVLERAIAESLKDDDAKSIEAAIAASLQHERVGLKRNFAEDDPGTVIKEEPGIGAGVLSLAFRLPNGERVTRRFESSACVRDVERFIEGLSAHIDMGKNCLAVAFPPRTLNEPSASLLEAGVSDKDTLTILMRASE